MDGHQDGEAHAETKRGKVRRILLDPLGFRWPKAVDEGEGRRRLDRLADDLGYMSEGRLAVLCDMLRGKGEGSAKNHWPDHATFIGWAEVVEPRPLEELPALMSWLASVEGPRAEAAGTLVETVDYVRVRKVPPVTPQARAAVAEKAAEAERRLQILGERQAAGMSVDPAEVAWADWYRGQMEAAKALVARARAGKDAA